MTELEVAKEVIIAYLSVGSTSDGLFDIYEIHCGNKKVLKEHIKALNKIFGVALEQVEKPKGDNK